MRRIMIKMSAVTFYSALTLAMAACSGPSVADPASTSQGPRSPAPPAAAQQDSKSSYRVWIDVDAAEQVAHIKAAIWPLPRTQVELELSFPDQYAFVTLPPHFTSPLQGTAAGRPLAFPRQIDPFRFRVKTEGAEAIELTWSIALDRRTHPEVIARSDGYEHSFVEEGLGMLFTAELVPVPNIEIKSTQVGVVGEFEDSVITPWGPGSASEQGTTVWTPPVEELSNDILLVGTDWTTVRTETSGLRATFALGPDTQWLRPIIERRLIPVVQAEVEMFGWTPREQFLFAFGPSSGTPGYGGSPKSGSMTMFVSGELSDKVARESVTHLVAHEFHHLWGHGTRAPSDELRFMTEGYTDYYSYIVPWRLGMISDATMHTTLESRLAAGAAALDKYGRSLSAAGGPEFFAGRDAYHACYGAGLALALWTDLALRKSGTQDGLDELMREWYRPSSGAARGSSPRTANLANWKSHLTSRLSASDVEHYMRTIEANGSVDWEALFDRVDLIVEQVGESFQISPSCLPRLR